MNVIEKSQKFLNDGNRKASGRPQQDPALLTLLTLTEKTKYGTKMNTRPATILLLLSVVGFSNALSTQSTPRSSSVSRKTFVNGVVAGVIGSTVLPGVAKADITNKLASTAALRKLKRAQNQLPKLEPIAEANDFAGVKEFLRTPPFGDSRKDCFVLVKGAEDGPKVEELDVVYKAFIASIENIDNTAGLGYRGRKIPQLQLSEQYLVVESTLVDFLKVAEEAALIPVAD
jgi:hypothetical protein